MNLHLNLNKVFLILLTIAILTSCGSTKNAIETKVFKDSNPVTDYAAEIVDFDLPKKLIPGQAYNASITFKNIGENIWTGAESYRLGVTANANPFGAARIDFSNADIVKKDDKYTFKFDFTAPAVPGLYVAQYQILRESVRWFGDSVEVKMEIPTEK